MKKKIITAVLCASALLAVFSGFSGTISAEDISVELDGTPIVFDVQPQLINGRAMVPLRTIFEEIGALVKWDSDTQTVSARKGKKTLTLSIGSSELTIDKGDTDSDGNPVTESVALDAPAQLMSGRTLVPLRAVSEGFGLNVEWESPMVLITSPNEDDSSWKENTGTLNLTDLSFTGEGIEILDNRILITKGGDFTVSGTLSDGGITISCDEKVKLRLSGASISSSDSPCIMVENADKAYITVTESTENTLTCLSGNAIHSKDNLEIKGKGSLSISADGGHGIKASDNLTIEGSNITINATSDGIHVNDTFKMTGGSLDITADGDGIDSESIVSISDGTINIKTCGVPLPAQADTENIPHRGGFEDSTNVEFEHSSKGISAEWMMCISGGEISISSASHAIHCQDEIQIDSGRLFLSSEYEKGISAHGSLTVNGSDTVIDISKSTEGLESKNILTVNDGTIKIFSTDDAINATGGNSGSMGMPGGVFGGRREERISPEQTADSEPNSDMKSRADKEPNVSREPKAGRPDDFMPNNTSDGFIPPDDSNFKPADENKDFPTHPDFSDGRPDDNRRPGGGNGRAMKDCLVINGGYLELYAEDDCLDSNGNLIINGGTIKATNPNGSFSGAFAVIDPDGNTTISENAELIFATQSGDERSLQLSQSTIIVYCESSHGANELITVTDRSGSTVLEYAPSGSFGAVLISSARLTIGKAYTITVGEESYTVTLSEQTATVGTKNSPSGHEHSDRGFGRP